MNRSIPATVVILACMLLTSISAAQTITFKSLLNEMVNRDTIARFPDPAYTCKQFSSYDRKSISPDDSETWFANGDASQYLRVEENDGRKEWVMMDTAGPGAIVRLWSANPKGTLRVYLDGSDEPAIEAPMTDILSGKWLVESPLSAVKSRGWNLYLPIPYAKHCKVTSDSDGFYYQINYRTYESGTKVQSFTDEAVADASQALDHAMHLLSNREQEQVPAGVPVNQRARIRPGESLSMELPAGPNAIRALVFSLSAADKAAALRSLVVEATFDGQQTIWCPLGDFLGTGIGATKLTDWYRITQSQGGGIVAWVMPYEKSGTIKLTNHSSALIQAAVMAFVSPWEWDDRSMHFHSTWKQDNPIPTRPMRDWNYATITGRGVYIGDNLAVVNPVKTWWGEGDEKIYVDGESFPSHFGTGTEDYYGYAWCWPETFEAPFHSQPRCDGPGNYGHTTVSRIRSLDAIPFNQSLQMDMEIWHWKDCDVGYAATTYFYALPGATTNIAPQPQEAARGVIDPAPLPPPFKIQGAIECETMQVISKTEGIKVGAQSGFGEGLWSGAQQLWIQGEQPGAFVELRFETEDGLQNVKVHATKSWDYGIVRFFINGKRAGPDVDLFNAEERKVIATGPIDLGMHEPQEGHMTLRIEVIGAHERSEATKSFFGLDCVVLTQGE